MDNPSDPVLACPRMWRGAGDTADERNPLDMTEEEIAEAHGELPPEKRAMSLGREVDSLSQPIGVGEIPTDSPEDQTPAS